MVVQKRVRQEAGLTARRGTLQWGVELIMGRGTLSWGGNPTFGRGTLPWGAEPYQGARNATMGLGNIAMAYGARNTTMRRGTLAWGAELYHGLQKPFTGREPYHETWNTTIGYRTLSGARNPTMGCETLS